MNRNRFRTALSVSAAIVLGACATPAVVFVSPTYNTAQVHQAALVTFTDMPGQQGSGTLVTDIFEKYLLNFPFQVVERDQTTGVDALIQGSISELTDTSEQTMMVDVPQEETDPVYGNVVTRQHVNGQTVVTRTPSVVGYNTTVTDQVVPETETMPARVGLSARMVSAVGGAVLWSGSSSADGMSISEAAENASSELTKALLKQITQHAKNQPS